MALGALRRFPAATAILAAAGLAVAVAVGAPPAEGRAYTPPGHHVFAGVTGGTSILPFQRLVHKHPPVFEIYMTWNTPTAWLARVDPGFRSRLGLHLSTASSYGGRGVISPLQIAQGDSDSFVMALGRNLQRSGRIVYLRIMGEMNGHWNPYAAFNTDGSYRGASNSPAAWIQAWRRTVLILRGGPVKVLDRRLRGLGMPPLRGALRRGLDGVPMPLPRPRVAFLWVPQDAGSPDIPANQPGAFWPGSAYVDWVGTDFYASYPNFDLLERFYARFTGKPFVLSEWALYGADDPSFVHRLFAWVRAHPRVRMLNYYQGFQSSSPANLAHYPAARRALAQELRSRRFLAYAPEYAHRRHHQPMPPQPPQPGPPPGPGPSPPAICVGLAGVCVPGV